MAKWMGRMVGIPPNRIGNPGQGPGTAIACGCVGGRHVPEEGMKGKEAASFDGDGLRLGKVRTELKFSLTATPAGCSRFRKIGGGELAERVAFWNDMDTAVV